MCRGEVRARICSRMGACVSVLLAEDDSGCRDGIEDVLLEEGHRVVCVRNGLEALTALDRIERPALIFLDVCMPLMDGTVFLINLRRRADREDFEVVVMSAVVGPDSFVNTPGVVAVLKKPFDVEEMLGGAQPVRSETTRERIEL